MTRERFTFAGLSGLIQRSRAWREARQRAAGYVSNPEKLKGLLDRASQKTRGARSGFAGELWTYLTAMIRLIRAYWKGTYRDVSREHLLTMIAVVVYFLMPIDVIPDWIFGVGFLDDAYVLTFALKTVKDALEAFMRWEQPTGASGS
jgi:uncharacterized membrane protein YkvA (DUF1232 family)